MKADPCSLIVPYVCQGLSDFDLDEVLMKSSLSLEGFDVVKSIGV